MKFNKKNTALLLATTLFSSSFTSIAYANSIPKTRTIKVRGIESLVGHDIANGDFMIVRGDRTFAVKNGFSLTAGDIIQTATGVTAYLEIDNAIVVEMFQNTKLEVEKTKSSELSINILEGEVFFDTNGSLKESENLQFGAGGMIMGVRGTSGVINVNEQGEANASLYTGLVEIIDVDDNRENPEVLMSLTPGNRIGHDGDFFVSEPYPNSLDDMSGYEVLVLTNLLDEYTEFSNFTSSTIEKTSLIREVLNSIFENSELPVVEFSTIDPDTPNTIIPPSTSSFDIEVSSNSDNSNNSVVSSNSSYSDEITDNSTSSTTTPALTPLEEILASLTQMTEEVKQEVVVKQEEEKQAIEEEMSSSSSSSSASANTATQEEESSSDSSSSDSSSSNSSSSNSSNSNSNNNNSNNNSDDNLNNDFDDSLNDDNLNNDFDDNLNNDFDDNLNNDFNDNLNDNSSQPDRDVDTTPEMPTDTSLATNNTGYINTMLNNNTECVFNGTTIDSGIEVDNGEILFINSATTLTNTLSVKSGGTLVIQDSMSLTGGAGKITLEGGAKLYNNGTLEVPVEIANLTIASLIRNTGTLSKISLDGVSLNLTNIGTIAEIENKSGAIIATLTNRGTIAELYNSGTITTFNSISSGTDEPAQVTEMIGSPAESSTLIGSNAKGVLKHTFTSDTATSANLIKILNNGGTTPYLNTTVDLSSAISSDDGFTIGDVSNNITRNLTLTGGSLTISGNITIENQSSLTLNSNTNYTGSGYINLNDTSKLIVESGCTFTISNSSLIKEETAGNYENKTATTNSSASQVSGISSTYQPSYINQSKEATSNNELEDTQDDLIEDTQNEDTQDDLIEDSQNEDSQNQDTQNQDTQDDLIEDSQNEDSQNDLIEDSQNEAILKDETSDDILKDTQDEE